MAMISLYIWLSAVLLSVSVHGSMIYVNGWSMTIADGVRAEEGGSAVLPCSFTHPDTRLTLTGSILWYKGKSWSLIFNCTYLGPDHSQGELCENVIQRDGWNRFRFVGNLSNKDASIMMEGLSLRDAGFYLCHVELNIGRIKSRILTNLEVKETFPIVILCIPLVVKLPPLLVMWIILYKQKTRRSNSVNIAHKYWCVCVTDRERERERENILWERPLIVSEDAARHAELFQQFSFLIQRLSPGPRLTNQRKHPLCI
ncbi:uncharacterized protein LOC122557009 isoform X5 [Chiloscyllium plagiosum]|uniref:uncharacterized protein LOC122557009 isoform X5 n=1 Tax=Chiloscyllium plagiosum TaxID=36176 RepID=UPI001CB842B5|nr:uncharacterized protein LOC122557009 isoform X5 [Chiloscyllium plagiosum]